MKVILAIDSAWTVHNPSGVAVIKSDGNKWSCAGVAPSYNSFIGLADGKQVDWRQGKFPGSVANIPVLLNAAGRLAGAQVDIVTIDMPISIMPITGSRIADREIGKAFGKYKAAAYTPNEQRPGQLGKDISDAFRSSGYQLATQLCHAGEVKRLIEVYPHPALVRLLNLTERLKYKVSKSKKYWPKDTLATRIENLLGNFNTAYIALGDHIGFSTPKGNLCFPDTAATLAELKPHEDALDALVCAWIGICYCSGKAESYGDDTAAIWVPTKPEAR